MALGHFVGDTERAGSRHRLNEDNAVEDEVPEAQDTAEARGDRRRGGGGICFGGHDWGIVEDQLQGYKVTKRCEDYPLKYLGIP
jgi:hypothetical protein